MLRSSMGVLIGVVACAGCSEETEPPPDDVKEVCKLSDVERQNLLPIDASAVPLLAGDFLYVPTFSLGEYSAVALRLGDGTVEDLGEVPALSDALSEPWQHAHDAVFARLSEGRLEIVDASNPLEPVYTAPKIGVGVRERSALGHVGSKFFFCSDDGSTGELVAIDLADPSSPTPAVPIDSPACTGPDSKGEGAIWVDLVAVSEEEMRVTAYRLEQPEVPVLERTFPMDQVGRFKFGDGVIAMFGWYSEQGLRVLRPDAPDEVPAHLTDANGVSLIAGTFAYSAGDSHPQFPWLPALRAVDLSGRSLITTYARLEPNVALGQRTGSGSFFLAHDEQRVVALSRYGDIYVSPIGSAANLKPLTWVDETGAAVCPLP